MRLLRSIYFRIRRLYRVHIERDPHSVALHQWRTDNCKSDMRLQYPLQSNSIVIDVGGFEGDFAVAIRKKYDAQLHVYEPVSSTFQRLQERLGDDNKCHLHQYGLSSKDETVQISLDENASTTFVGKQIASKTERIQLKDIAVELERIGLKEIALIKINIEGGEYDLLERLIEADKLSSIEHVLVQFHSFMDNAQQRRQRIRDALQGSHRLQWDYPFVWESWKRV